MFRNKIILPAWKGKSFFTKSCLLADCNFSEKPAFLKKLKMKQAKFQKEDGLPVFLKMGFRDKLLFNVTWLGIFAGTLESFYILHLFDLKYK